MVGQLAGEMRASKRTTAETMTKVFGVPMSIGAVIDAQNRVAAAVAEPCREARAHVQQQTVKNADETPWKQGVRKAYIWVCVTACVTVFVIQTSRAATAAQTLLGAVLGVLGTDRYVGYAWWPTRLRQLCWAHLVRDFRAIAERGGRSGDLGAALLTEAACMFGWWHQMQAGELTRTTFQVYMRPLRQRVEDLLAQGCHDPHDKTAGTCANLWAGRAALWTFVRLAGVEPTNNAAEQALRFGVLWRKMCYGTQSLAGSQFVARILTVHATLRQQGRSVHAYLRQACTAHRAGTTPPSLVPNAAA
jgi:transposase